MAVENSESGSMKAVKYFSLVALVFQNAANILVMRYVRTRKGELFKSSTAVIMAELLKCTTCLLVILFQEGSFRKWLSHLYDNIIKQPMDCLKISVPAIVYVLQNNLLYLAVSNLDAATFQVTYQLKLLTTALFSVIMLRKKLSKWQWFSLVTLFIGVSTVQLQPHYTHATKVAAQDQNPIIGLIAVVVSCMMSGFAGVYFEKLLKGTEASVWLRNVQLGSLGIVFGIITMEMNDGKVIHEKGFFQGYDALVWVVIGLQSFGGLIVAVVVKYADNILKGFATSASIVISCVVSMFLFDFVISPQFCLGAVLVMVSVFLYGRFPFVAPTENASESKA